MRSWTGELACARVCLFCNCTAAGLLEKSWDGARWLTKCAGDNNNNNQQRNRAALLSWPARAISPARHLFVRPFSFPASQAHGPMSIYGSFAQQSRPALHLRGAYTSARTPYHQPNPFESQARTWMRGGPPETPIYGWSWPSTTKPLGRMIGHAQRPRYVVIVFLYCPTPLSYFPLSRHAHLRCNLHYSPSLTIIHDLTILLCTTSLSCWHGFPVTIVIHLNHQRDPASRYSTFFLPTSFFAQQQLNTIAKPRHRLANPHNTR